MQGNSFDPYAVEDDEQKDPDHPGGSGDKLLEEMSKGELESKLANDKSIVISFEKEKTDNPIKQAMLTYAEKTPKEAEAADKAKAVLLKVREHVLKNKWFQECTVEELRLIALFAEASARKKELDSLIERAMSECTATESVWEKKVLEMARTGVDKKANKKARK